MNEIVQIALEKYKAVMEQREEILTAFIAKYGIQPEYVCQVEWRKTPFITEWSIQHNSVHFCENCEKLIK